MFARKVLLESTEDEERVLIPECLGAREVENKSFMKGTWPGGEVDNTDRPMVLKVGFETHMNILENNCTRQGR